MDLSVPHPKLWEHEACADHDLGPQQGFTRPSFHALLDIQAAGIGLFCIVFYVPLGSSDPLYELSGLKACS